MFSSLNLQSLLIGFGSSIARANEFQYDYIVLGGGTCGLVVANRLSEDPSIRVAVVEAGDSVKLNPNVSNTTQFGLALGSSIDWAYQTLPQQYADNKTFVFNAGKALGGTSTINGMTYIRAEKAQIDVWEALGNPGWNWKSLYPYIKRSEAFQPPSPQQEANGAAYDPKAHGFNGPLAVGFNPSLLGGDIHSIINETWRNVGLPWKREINDGTLRGFTVWPQTLDAREDVREDAARAYYYPIEGRRNLVVLLNTTASRIVWADAFEQGDRRATGADIVLKDGTMKTISARREVILAAGSLRTPVLLERSGVGNPEILNKHAIKPVIALPSVGENLQDQTNVIITRSTNRTFAGYPPYATFVNATDLFGTNTTTVYKSVLAQLPEYASTISKASRYALKAAAQEKLLRVQIDLIFVRQTSVAELLTVTSSSPGGSIIGSAFWGLLPFARGSVHISSSDINAPPAITPNFFMLEWDRMLQVATARLARKALLTAPLSQIADAEMSPGAAVPIGASDETWLSWLKKNFSPNNHPVGTAAMLPRDLGGVVNHELKVYGTSNVRVVDASMLPFQINGHLTSTLYAVAEKASDIIRHQQPPS